MLILSDINDFGVRRLDTAFLLPSPKSVGESGVKPPHSKLTFLREYPTHSRRFRYAINGENVCAGAHVGSVTLGRLMHLMKRVAHGIFERLVDPRFAPEKRILVLDPFVIADRDAAGIRENIGNQHHAVIFKHAI